MLPDCLYFTSQPTEKHSNHRILRIKRVVPSVVKGRNRPFPVLKDRNLNFTKYVVGSLSFFGPCQCGPMPNPIGQDINSIAIFIERHRSVFVNRKRDQLILENKTTWAIGQNR